MALSDWLTARYSVPYTTLGWTSWTSIVADSLELYGVSLEAQATDTEKLHKLATYAVWAQAQRDVSLKYNVTVDNQRLDRKGMHEMVSKNLSEAWAEAMPYLSAYQIGVEEITVSQDPYSYSEDRDEAGNF